jgi:hypothetical protein
MYLRIETNWPCWKTFCPECEGGLVVIAENTSYSVCCNKCGYGNTGTGELPDFYMKKLIEEGYIRQLSRRPVDIDDVHKFLMGRVSTQRTYLEMAGDFMEKFEVFWK